jgi:hypothetical protein
MSFISTCEKKNKEAAEVALKEETFQGLAKASAFFPSIISQLLCLCASIKLYTRVVSFIDTTARTAPHRISLRQNRS